MKWAAFAGLCAAIFSLGLLPLFAATKHPIAVLIVDGQSAGPYHDWQLTTQVLRKELEETALFQVTVATSPESGGDFSSFKPKFSDYAVIVWNYDAPNWPGDLRAQLEQYVSNGDGLVVVYAADNAFPDWEAYNLMTGIGGWRNRTEQSGSMWYFRDGKLVSDTVSGFLSKSSRVPPSIPS